MAPKSNDKPVELTASTTKPKDSKKKTKSKGGESDIVEEENALSEEDRALKERLETCISTLLNTANESSVTIPIRLTALNVICDELKSATSSMTSVPKPLKFLRPKYDVLKEYYGGLLAEKEMGEEDLVLRARLADVLAVLAMTLGKHGERLRGNRFSVSLYLMLCFCSEPYIHHFNLPTHNKHRRTRIPQIQTPILQRLQNSRHPQPHHIPILQPRILGTRIRPLPCRRNRSRIQLPHPRRIRSRHGRAIRRFTRHGG